MEDGDALRKTAAIMAAQLAEQPRAAQQARLQELLHESVMLYSLVHQALGGLSPLPPPETPTHDSGEPTS